MIKRPATAADLPQLIALEAACNPHPWSGRQLEASLVQDSVEVMDNNGQIVAMLVSKSLFGEAEIYLLDTLAAFRRQGWAKQLILGLQAANERIFLEVRASNVAANMCMPHWASDRLRCAVLIMCVKRGAKTR